MPIGWSLVALDELRATGDYTFVGGPFGSDLTTADYVNEPGVPVIRGTNLGGKESRFIDDGFVYVTEQKATDLRRNTAYPGDVVFTQRGTLGQVALIPLSARFSRYVISQSQMKLTPDSSKIDSRFLYYYFRAPKTINRLLSETQATGVPHINLGILKRFPVMLPPLKEQRRIAGILDRAAELQAKRRAAIVQLDELTQAIFLDMFGDPIKNPNNFPISPMIDLIDPNRPISYGILMPGPDQVEGVKYVRVTDMKNGGIDLSGIRQTTEEMSNSFRRSLLKPGDLLMSIRGHVGRFAVIPPELDGANITQDSARLAIVGASSVFVRECLRTVGFQRWMARHTKGVAVRGINLGDVKLMPIILPPRSAQDDFAAKADLAEKLKASHHASLAEMDALFASLQHRAFRGEL